MSHPNHKQRRGRRLLYLSFTLVCCALIGPLVLPRLRRYMVTEALTHRQLHAIAVYDITLSSTAQTPAPSDVLTRRMPIVESGPADAAIIQILLGARSTPWDIARASKEEANAYLTALQTVTSLASRTQCFVVRQEAVVVAWGFWREDGKGVTMRVLAPGRRVQEVIVRGITPADAGDLTEFLQTHPSDWVVGE